MIMHSELERTGVEMLWPISGY